MSRSRCPAPFARALPALALLAGCRAVLGADFDRPGAPDDAGSLGEGGSSNEAAALDAGASIEGSSPNTPDACAADAGCDLKCQAGYARYGAGCFRSASWTTIGKLPDSLCEAASWGGAAVESDGRMVVFTQTQNALAGISDARLAAWTLIVPPPDPTSGYAVARSTSGKVYVIGGTAGANLSYAAYGSVDAYDPAVDKWTVARSIPSARSGLVAVSGQDGWIYALGGRVFGGEAGSHGAPSPLLEAYDPATDRWTTMLQPMPAAREAFAAAVAADGRIYTFGGTKDQINPLDTVEAYSPATNTWAPSAKLPVPREYAASAALTDGRILIVGGITYGPNGADQAWDTTKVAAFDPATKAWSKVADIAVGRRFASALTGPDGRVYLVGGLNGEQPGVCVKEIEVYTP